MVKENEKLAVKCKKKEIARITDLVMKAMPKVTDHTRFLFLFSCLIDDSNRCVGPSTSRRETCEGTSQGSNCESERV